MNRTARIAALHLDHRGGDSLPPAGGLDSVAPPVPDMLVFTGYVDSAPQQGVLRQRLAAHGYRHVAMSVAGERQTRVVMASKHVLADEHLLPVPGYTEAATTNWLQRRCPALGIEVVGLQAPAYEGLRDRLGYWSQVQAILRLAVDRPLLAIGNFGCDPLSDTAPGSQVLHALQGEGFSLAEPAGTRCGCEACRAGLRADHALATPRLRILEARYVVGSNGAGATVTGPAGRSPSAGHAALCVTVQS